MRQRRVWTQTSCSLVEPFIYIFLSFTDFSNFSLIFIQCLNQRSHEHKNKFPILLLLFIVLICLSFCLFVCLVISRQQLTNLDLVLSKWLLLCFNSICNFIALCVILKRNPFVYIPVHFLILKRKKLSFSEIITQGETQPGFNLTMWVTCVLDAQLAFSPLLCNYL